INVSLRIPLREFYVGWSLIHCNIYIISFFLYSEVNDSMDEIEDILQLVLQVEKALKNKNPLQIKKVSEEIIQHTTMHQDEDLVAFAVIIYALSKLIEREIDVRGKLWAVFYKKFYRNINDMILALREKDIQKFREEISANRKLIDGLVGDVRKYINDVFIKAKINKASQMYEHGISMGKTAQILGISMWDIAEYSGQKGITDPHHLSLTLPIKERIALVEEIFKQ
ncbi:MAG: hypothetical protein AABX16_01485, partial [Nanoarchaeota archaeon]